MKGESDVGAVVGTMERTFNGKMFFFRPEKDIHVLVVMAKRIFVTYTPFHVLAACGLASELGSEGGNILIFFKDFPNSEVYYDAIMEWEGNPFKEVVVMDAGT
jgi:hypothetical protein